MRKLTHSLTAYRCRICEKYHDKDLLNSEETDSPLDLETILFEFFSYIKECKIDNSTNRTILLANPMEKAYFNNGIERIYITPEAGRALEKFSVINHRTNKLTVFDGFNNSAIYSHNVLCYIDGEKNVIIFHRYGQSGCKTAFQNTLNTYLSTKGLIAHFDVLLSREMFDGSEKYIPEKLSLITTYEEISSDKAENLEKKPRKLIEQETIISLNAPRAKNIRNWFKNLRQKDLTIDELKQILIRDNFPDDFEDIKATLKFGKVRRRISVSEFTGLIAEYDVTEKLEILADGAVRKESLFGAADDYALGFLREKDV